MSAYRVLVALVLILVVSGAAAAASDDLSEASGRADRGIAGTITVDGAPRLRARDGIGRNTEGLAPISIRVEFDSASGRHEIEFVGAVAGTFDLRGVLERVDGGEMAEVTPIIVVVSSRLPVAHGSDLFGSSSPALADGGMAVPWTWIAVGAWLIWPVVILLVWLWRRDRAAATPEPPPPAPTLDEEIAALLDRAADESTGTDVRARLELLVFRRLAAHIDDAAPARTAVDEQVNDGERVPERIAETVRTLRRHPATRDLVAAIEAWLHARDGTARRGDAIALLREFHGSRIADTQGAIAAETAREVPE